MINGKSAFVSYVSRTQVNVLLPPDTATGIVKVEVKTNQGTVPATVNMATMSPALFTYPLSNTTYAAALNASDYTYVAGLGIACRIHNPVGIDGSRVSGSRLAHINRLASDSDSPRANGTCIDSHRIRHGSASRAGAPPADENPGDARGR